MGGSVCDVDDTDFLEGNPDSVYIDLKLGAFDTAVARAAAEAEPLFGIIQLIGRRRLNLLQIV